MRWRANPARSLGYASMLGFAGLLLCMGLMAGSAAAGNPEGGNGTTGESAGKGGAAAPLDDAYMVLRPQAGAPPNGGSVNVGTKFTLDLVVNTGVHDNVAATQDYILFDNPQSPSGVLKVLPSASGNCSAVPVSTTVAADTSTFDAVLQNEVCNGPGPCTLRGVNTLPGNLAFASGALGNCPNGCGPGEFRVAQITLCAATGGTGTLQWQFSPPAPSIRDTEIIDISSQSIENPALFVDYVIHVNAPTATPTATLTRTPAPTATACPINFSDVQQSDYFYEPVRYLYCGGAISGYGDNTFRPYNNTTRGQLTKIVVLAEDWALYTPTAPTFSDVPQSHAFYRYVETAYARGIISGYGDNTFRPDSGVTRGQLSKITVAAAGWPLYTPPTPSFEDVHADNAFYSYIETAYQHGIISGYLDGTFRPGSSATRGQIAKIVYLAVIHR